MNWFTGQRRLKPKCARPISGNRLTAGTKLKIEQFFKTFEDLIRSFLPELIFGADKTMVNVNKACTSFVSEGYAEVIEPIRNNLPFGTSRV
jgi:hypothetical protein